MMATANGDNFASLLNALTAIARSHKKESDAEAFLTNASTQLPGFYLSLLDIYTGPSHIDAMAKDLAAITFKNGVSKYWRSSATNSIPDHEKEVIKSKIIESSSLAVPASVARQNSLSIAKIVRQDFPSRWPDCFDHLLQVIKQCQSNETELFRHVWTLHQVIKGLCTLRISGAKENLQRAAPSLLQFIDAAYNAFVQRWLNHPLTSISIDTLRISDLSLKIARRLICYGFESPYRDETCRAFFQKVSSQLPTMWTMFANMSMERSGQDLRLELISKHLLHAGKFFLELSSNAMENYAMNYSFVLMPNSMQLAKTYWRIVMEAAGSNQTDIQKVIIQGMILLKQCVKLVGLPETSLRIMKDKESLEVRESLRILHTELFSPESLTTILENLITLYFVLTSDDIDEWESCPEDWMNSQDSSQWQFDLRPCAERLFLDLFAQFKSVLLNPLFGVLQATLQASSGRDLLMKEAMYNALGIAAPHLFDDFDFDSFLEVLRKESQDSTLATIFKRRILVLIAQWASVKCSEAKRPLIYEIIASQMQSGNEEANGLMLAAALTVHQVIDDWEWQVSSFEPFAVHISQSLLQCLALSHDTQTRIKLLTTLGSICERLGQKIHSEIGSILHQITTEWVDSENEVLLRVALLGLLSRIVLSQKDLSSQCYPVVLPLIQYSTDASNGESIYLMEEALELWHALLQNAFEADQYLLQLFPIILQPQCLPTATDNLKKILFIVESNILLLSEELLTQGFATRLVNDMISMLPGLSSDALSHFTRILGIAAQLWSYNCFTDNNIWNLSELLLAPASNTITQTCYICLLSQLLLCDPHRTVSIWAKHSGGDLTESFVKSVGDKFDNIGHPKHRKACAMALTAIVSTGHPVFKNENNLAILGSIWGDVLAEVQASGDDLIYWADDSALIEDLEAESPEVQRRKKLSERDPWIRAAWE